MTTATVLIFDPTNTEVGRIVINDPDPNVAIGAATRLLETLLSYPGVKPCRLRISLTAATT